jgi:hypothetical protein
MDKSWLAKTSAIQHYVLNIGHFSTGFGLNASHTYHPAG